MENVGTLAAQVACWALCALVLLVVVLYVVTNYVQMPAGLSADGIKQQEGYEAELNKCVAEVCPRGVRAMSMDGGRWVEANVRAGDKEAMRSLAKHTHEVELLDKVPALPEEVESVFAVRRRACVVHSDDWALPVHVVDHVIGGADTPVRATVLMFHGNPTWSFLWRKVIKALEGLEAAQGLRVIAPDLMGCGLSGKPDNDAMAGCLALHVSVVTSVVKALGVDSELPVLIMGQDWGGPTVTAVAARLEAETQVAIQGVVYANTAVSVPKKFHNTWFHRFSHTAVAPWVFRPFLFPMHNLNAVQGDSHSLRILSAETRAYMFPFRAHRDRAAPLAMAKMVPNTPTHDSLAVFEMTDDWFTAYRGEWRGVWGTRDPILGKVHYRMAKLNKGPIELVDTAGHFLQEQCPERLAGAVVDILGALGGAE